MKQAINLLLSFNEWLFFKSTVSLERIVHKKEIQTLFRPIWASIEDGVVRGEHIYWIL
jgi:hypothetical protein